MAPKPCVREKTRDTCAAHIAAHTHSLTPLSQLLLGDSHTERLIWRFPSLAPQNTWLCGVGGDRLSQLAWRVANPDSQGYTQHPALATAEFARIGIMIGTNDILDTQMTRKQVGAMVAKVEAMVAKVRERWPGALVTVFPIPPLPTRGRQVRDQKSVDTYNEGLKECGLVTVDWPEMDLDADYEDDVHLSDTGYAKWREMIRVAGFQ
ncbi:SGNH hydrolase-type esterase domain-containing protein [Chytriomyces sp. MP71]|nr:SGNH hydrolase-type esterase domain-containing protein [Chytriomyces sp. MP71]